MSETEIVRMQEQVVSLFKGQERLEKRQAEHEEDDQQAFEKINDKIDALQTRLPVWATFLIATLTAACGWLVGLVVRG